jgi:two-component system, NtrC family, sensor histidine kinase HydH
VRQFRKWSSIRRKDKTMTRRNKFHVGAIVATTAVISYFHYTLAPVWPLQSILMDLYYLPVLAGALVFGLRGALVTYIVVVGLYVPYILVVWHVRSTVLAEDLLHTLFFGIFALIAGGLVDRERRWRLQAERDGYLAALGRVTTTISHELRNPLAVIRGFTERMEKGKGDSRRAIEAILRATETMHRILESTLDFARPLQMNLMEEDIVTIVNRAILAVAGKSENRGVKLSFSPTTGPIPVIVDGFLLERAVVNLIDNAIDASDSGQTVTITAQSHMGSVLITVDDKGSGMDKETLDKVFLPFYTRKDRGTGVGMAFTKKIIDQHGGSIDVQSQPGAGTSISLHLRSGTISENGAPKTIRRKRAG